LRGGVVNDNAFTTNTINAFNTAMNEAIVADQEASKVGILKRISESHAYINRLLYLSTKELATQIIRQMRTGAPAITGLVAGNEILKDYTPAGGAAAAHEQDPTLNGVALALQTFIDNCDQSFGGGGGGGGVDIKAIKTAYTALIGRMILIYAEYLKMPAPQHRLLIGPNAMSVDNWGNIHSAITVALVGSSANDETAINAAVTAVKDEEDRIIGAKVINATIQGIKRDTIQTIIDNKLYNMTNKYIGIRTIIGFFDDATISAFRVHLKLLGALDNFEVSYFNLLQNIATLGVVGAPGPFVFGSGGTKPAAGPFVFGSGGAAPATGATAALGGGATAGVTGATAATGATAGVTGGAAAAPSSSISGTPGNQIYTITLYGKNINIPVNIFEKVKSTFSSLIDNKTVSTEIDKFNKDPTKVPNGVINAIEGAFIQVDTSLNPEIKSIIRSLIHNANGSVYLVTAAFDSVKRIVLGGASTAAKPTPSSGATAGGAKSALGGSAALSGAPGVKSAAVAISISKISQESLPNVRSALIISINDALANKLDKITPAQLAIEVDKAKANLAASVANPQNPPFKLKDVLDTLSTAAVAASIDSGIKIPTLTKQLPRFTIANFISAIELLIASNGDIQIALNAIDAAISTSQQAKIGIKLPPGSQSTTF
jgi:hypothetical protein